MNVSKARLAAGSLRVLPRKHISRAMGRLSDLSAPKRLVDEAIRTFIKIYAVDMSEAEVPDGGFATFDDFFTRTLKPGSRVVDSRSDVLVSPSDGMIHDCGPITHGATFLVKGRSYTVAEMLGSVSQAPPSGRGLVSQAPPSGRGLIDRAEAFEGGAFAVIYLAPPDYHRVHAPVDGRVLSFRHVDGTLYPVNSIGAHFPKLFAENERVVVAQQSKVFGEVVSILVGAIGVGRISLAFDDLRTNVGPRGGGFRSFGDAGPTLARGDELGAFHLGSTVVLFLPPAASIEWLKQSGDRVRMGEALARATSSKRERGGARESA